MKCKNDNMKNTKDNGKKHNHVITMQSTLNGQIKFILKIQMVGFTRLKSKIYHKFGLKIMRQKKYSPTCTRD
jgi:hypothetical protein